VESRARELCEEGKGWGSAVFGFWPFFVATAVVNDTFVETFGPIVAGTRFFSGTRGVIAVLADLRLAD